MEDALCQRRISFIYWLLQEKFVQLPKAWFSKRMVLISWNVNSLRSTENTFLNFIEEYSPDIVMVQELRAFTDQLSFFLKQIPGYKAFFNPSSRPGYSGTALYYKETLDLADITASLNNKILDSEGRVIYSKFNNVNIFNFYTPNGSSSNERLDFKLKYYKEMLNFFKILIKGKQSIVVGGDLNVAPTSKDLYDPKGNRNHSGFLPAEKSWFKKLKKIGFIDTFRMFNTSGGNYTWWHFRDPKREKNHGWRFDYFLVSKDLKPKVVNADLLKTVFGSDHCPILLEINI